MFIDTGEVSYARQCKHIYIHTGQYTHVYLHTYTHRVCDYVCVCVCVSVPTYTERHNY